MSAEDSDPYKRAFELKNAGRFQMSIAEFERIADTGEDPKHLCKFMIAMLYCYELDDYVTALPYSIQAAQASPKNEKASLCLVHCLLEAGRREEAHDEIRRYVAAGGRIDFYQVLFDENSLSAENFR